MRKYVIAFLLGLIASLLIFGSCSKNKADKGTGKPTLVQQKQVAAKVVGNCSVLECVAILAQHGFVVLAQCPDVPDTIQWTWDASEFGSPAIRYIAKVEMKGGVVYPPLTLYVGEDIDSTRIAVAGVDAEDRVGPWSVWSDWHEVIR